MPEVLATYRLELWGPPAASNYENIPIEAYVGLASTFLSEIQENATDILPEGYSVRIRPEVLDTHSVKVPVCAHIWRFFGYDIEYECWRCKRCQRLEKRTPNPGTGTPCR